MAMNGTRVAALVANEGVEQVELTKPMEAIRQAGGEVSIVAPKGGEVQAFEHLDKAQTFPVDRPLTEVSVDDFDALLLPGGVANPDQLRMEQAAVDFVRGFVEAGKPVAVICHGAWIMIEAGIVRGLKMTSYPSLKTDLRNAGADWVDEEVTNDRGVVSSRKPQDLPAFSQKMIEEFAEGQHGGAGRRQPAQMRT